MLENFLNMDLSGFRGAEPPEASENIKKLVQNQWKTENFGNFSWNFSEFWLEKANFNQNYGNFDGILKSFNNFKRN